MAQVLCQLPKATPNPNLLVGLDTSDDAGVYKLTDDIALVQTVDYFTPIVDDPYMFGQIAAANALSDVYAMGGKPITALNIVGFPISKLPKQMLADILRGASDKIAEAGATLVGGHSIDDNEPKFGMAVTGTIHPSRINANVGAKKGDKLVLTKPIGVGILTTSLKKDALTEEEISAVTHVMATLNKDASEVMQNYHVNACTDVTGFGLLGHASEMAIGSGVTLTLSTSHVPLLPRTKELAAAGNIPGGTRSNHKWLQDRVTYGEDLDELDQLILCDAVTSGGLLMSVDPSDIQLLMNDLEARGIHAAVIGEVTDEGTGHLFVK